MQQNEITFSIQTSDIESLATNKRDILKTFSNLIESISKNQINDLVVCEDGTLKLKGKNKSICLSNITVNKSSSNFSIEIGVRLKNKQ